MMDEIKRATAIAECHGFLRSRGIEVSIVHNLETLPDTVGRSSKPYLTPLISPGHNDLTEGNSLWLVGLKGSEPVMLGGARLECVGRDGLAGFWRRSFKRAYGAEIKNVNVELHRQVAGRLVYFGDMFVNSRCGAGLLGARAFTAIGHLVAHDRWRQDWTYSFLHDRDVTRGAGIRYGFNWFQPAPFEWVEVPETRSDSEWCGLVSAWDMPKMIHATVRAIQMTKEV